MTQDRIGIPSIPRDIAKELSRYGKDSLEDLRTAVMTSYLNDDEKYDVRKHHNQEWVQLAIRITRTQYENWFTVALFGACIDFFIRDHQLGTDIKRLIITINKLLSNFN